MDFRKSNDMLPGTYPGLDWAYANPFYRNSLRNKSLIKQPILTGFEDSKEYDFTSDIDDSIPSDNSTSSFIDDIFFDRTQSHKSTIDEILSEIEERKQIKQKNCLEINRDMCKVETHLLELENLANGLYTLNFGRRRTALDHEIFNLESEKREQEVECWRDLVFLQKDLLATLGEYWASLRRKQVMEMDLNPTSLAYGMNAGTGNEPEKLGDD